MNNNKSGILRNMIAGVVLVFVFIGTSSGDDEDAFRKFQKSQMKAFEQEAVIEFNEEYETYKETIFAEFEAYKKIIDAEFSQYRKELLNVWDDAKISSRRSWTEYSEDLKTRRTVDFENQFIELDIIVEKETEKNIDSLFIDSLTELLLEDQNTAFQRDTLSQRIETRVKNEIPDVKTSEKVSKKPIITTVITGEPDPSEEKVLKIAKEMKKKGKVTIKDSKKVTDAKVASLMIPLPSEALQKKADEIYPYVEKYSKERKLELPLVMGVIHTESCFNPMARSYVPAYGLMQIVPESAGMDAAGVIIGKPVLLSPSYLYDVENNINVGCTYLDIVMNRYLRKIENPESRLFCGIAAYNTGAGNVAKAFTGNSMKVSRAADKINAMEPDEVYDHLEKNLPYKETRSYLGKVCDRMTLYRNYY